MLPPIDDSLLQANPNFALLYKRLTATLLNPDASTNDADSPEAKQRDAVHKVFQTISSDTITMDLKDMHADYGAGTRQASLDGCKTPHPDPGHRNSHTTRSQAFFTVYQTSAIKTSI